MRSQPARHEGTPRTHRALTRVQPEAFPGSVATGSAGPLAGGRFGDGRDHQRLDGGARIVGSQLDKSTVDDEHDPVDGDGGLGYVGGHHNLETTTRWKTDSFLHIARAVPATGVYLANGDGHPLEDLHLLSVR